ncbi:MAG: (d)CMP kinase, partial [Acidimicrobiia bacterium]|nr:(d)CMP kinase [Acidimicrobiia bacterium]
AIDSGRSVSPLIAAQDALRLDSTTMTIDEVVETIVSEFLTREALQ